MPRNPGHLSPEAAGKRVHVILTNGCAGRTDGNPMSPIGWAADGKGGCRWTRTGHAFDIETYEVST